MDAAASRTVQACLGRAPDWTKLSRSHFVQLDASRITPRRLQAFTMVKNDENSNEAARIAQLRREKQQWEERLRQRVAEVERLRREKAALEKSVRDKEAIARARR